MKNNDYTVKLGNWQHLKPGCRLLREVIFIQEQNVPVELEWDGLDRDCIHTVAHDHVGNAIATGRLLADGHIGRMAVLSEWRNKGVGSTILELLVKHSLEQLGQKPWLDAQVRAVNFYRRHGFRAQGEVFMDAGIPHRHMVWSGDTINSRLKK